MPVVSGGPRKSTIHALNELRQVLYGHMCGSLDPRISCRDSGAYTNASPDSRRALLSYTSQDRKWHFQIFQLGAPVLSTYVNIFSG